MTRDATPEGLWRGRMLARVTMLVLVVLPFGPTTWCEVQAQPAARVQRVGWLDTFDAANEPHDTLTRSLEELGHKQGRTFSMILRHAEYRLERLPELARLLVAERPDVIVALGDPAIAASRAASSTIPIVMIQSVDAVKAGHVQSLARLAVLKYPVPHLDDLVLPEIRAAARAAGVSITVRDVRDRKDMELAFEALKRERTDAVLVLAGGVLDTPARLRAAQLGLKYQLPVASDSLSVTYEGGLLSYNARFSAQIQRAAFYVDRILKGTRPADLPVEQPREFDLVVNAEVAKQLKIVLPPTLLLRATKVIE